MGIYPKSALALVLAVFFFGGCHKQTENQTSSVKPPKQTLKIRMIGDLDAAVPDIPDDWTDPLDEPCVGDHCDGWPIDEVPDGGDCVILDEAARNLMPVCETGSPLLDCTGDSVSCTESDGSEGSRPVCRWNGCSEEPVDPSPVPEEPEMPAEPEVSDPSPVVEVPPEPEVPEVSDPSPEVEIPEEPAEPEMSEPSPEPEPSSSEPRCLEAGDNVTKGMNDPNYSTDCCPPLVKVRGVCT